MEKEKLTIEDTEAFSLRSIEWVESELSGRIIGCAMKVHTGLGPGLLESAYEECFFYELLQAGLKVKKQVAMPLIYSEVKMDIGYRVDILVENKIIVAVEAFHDIHIAQVLTYLKLSGCKLGLLINFNVSKLKNGIKRLVL